MNGVRFIQSRKFKTGGNLYLCEIHLFIAAVPEFTKLTQPTQSQPFSLWKDLNGSHETTAVPQKFFLWNILIVYHIVYFKINVLEICIFLFNLFFLGTHQCKALLPICIHLHYQIDKNKEILFFLLIYINTGYWQLTTRIVDKNKWQKWKKGTFYHHILLIIPLSPINVEFQVFHLTLNTGRGEGGIIYAIIIATILVQDCKYYIIQKQHIDIHQGQLK